jgi:23S rRNA (pseudouridine1915-N3)-methyltransferase
VKTLLLTVGKLRSAPLHELCADYLRRLQRFGPAEVQEVKASTRPDARQAVAEECARLSDALETSDRVFILDESGVQASSVELAELLARGEREALKRSVFVLGGAYGLTPELKARGKKLGLSRLTLPHELCRCVMLEQLYRARTILNNLPYHHA